jgi:23S rRNA pseudouridine955/2504/2580 synthase
MIELPLAKQPGTGGEKMMVDESEHGLPSRTRYRVIDRAGNRAAWVELQPFTGRTHQLRVHMAAIGHPIVGDGKYGGQAAFLSGSISRKLHLHARRLRIEHPEGDLLDVTAPLPEHFAKSLEQMGFTESEGDLPLEAPVFAEPKEIEKRAAKAHAKQYRKERRGERRKRADEGSNVARKPSGQRAGKPGGKPAGKPTAKPGTARTAKPAAGQTRTANPGAGKPAARRPAARPAAKPSGPRKPAGK